MTDIAMNDTIALAPVSAQRRSAVLIGASPGGTMRQKLAIAVTRSIRTLLQGLAAAFPAAGAGSAILAASYWRTVQYSCLAAVVTALVTLLQNVANFLPDDPTQGGNANC